MPVWHSEESFQDLVESIPCRIEAVLKVKVQPGPSEVCPVSVKSTLYS